MLKYHLTLLLLMGPAVCGIQYIRELGLGQARGRREKMPRFRRARTSGPVALKRMFVSYIVLVPTVLNGTHRYLFRHLLNFLYV